MSDREFSVTVAKRTVNSPHAYRPRAVFQYTKTTIACSTGWLAIWGGFVAYALLSLQSPQLAFVCGFFGLVPVWLYCWASAAWLYPVRRLLARWTMETQQDLESIHGLNVEEEQDLLNAMVKSIEQDVNDQVIKDMVQKYKTV